MVNIFIEPGTGPERNQRSIEYDTVSDSYLHRLLDEIFPVVAKSVEMRTDGYSRAIQGLSSGGIMAFNAAFHRPEEFSRVLSWIGSYTALQRSTAHRRAQRWARRSGTAGGIDVVVARLRSGKDFAGASAGTGGKGSASLAGGAVESEVKARVDGPQAVSA
jgi:enterochelin esterase-like enzyme